MYMLWTQPTSKIVLYYLQFLLDEKNRVWETIPEVFASLMKYHVRKVSMQLMMFESKRLTVQKRSMSYIALLTHWHHFMSICTLLMQSSVPCIPGLSSLPLTGWPGHECRNGSHHMVLSECRGVFEEGGGDHQTVWDLHQTGALHKIVYQSIHT